MASMAAGHHSRAGIKLHKDRSLIRKRSVKIGGHNTSITMEDAFWFRLHDIAKARNLTLGRLIAQIEDTRTTINLSSLLRVFVLEHANAAHK